MSERMAKRGYVQGDMHPTVENYQRPDSEYTDHGFSKTLDYIERHNAFEGKEAREIKSQAYKGRYS
jgi:hypothetical protein